MCSRSPDRRNCWRRIRRWRAACNRSPYIDPLNHLQITLLRRLRAGAKDEIVKRATLFTINGIAAALRNSG